jgi:AraC family transcriptional regulator of adaptative response / DNA-3-methyladenine glycosylase II
MFDLTADPGRVTATMRSDALMQPLIERRPGLRIPGVWDPFECCVRAIVGQGIKVSAALEVLEELTERFGKPIEPLLTGISHLFPAAAVLADANLNELKISHTRRKALRQLARGVCDKAIRFDAPGAEVGRMLRTLPGVGQWTADYVALRGLGEPDAFPFGDRLLRRLATTGKKPLTPLALAARAECWRPFRGYAVFHLWAAAAAGGASRGIVRRPKTAGT